MIIPVPISGKPLAKLIETVGAGVGKLYEPVGTILQAKADAKAAVIRAESAGEVAEVEARIRRRLAHVEAIRQSNLDRIVAQAAIELPETVADEPVNRDWTLQFFTCAQDVCDEDMQRIWARILAGEVEKPGSFRRRTLELLKTLEKSEAESFTKVCSLAFNAADRPFVFIAKATAKTLGPIVSVDNLASIGLLATQSLMLDRGDMLGKKLVYFDREFECVGDPVPSRHLDKLLAIHTFSTLGAELFGIAGPIPSPGYIEQLNAELKHEPGDFQLREITSQ